MSENKRIELLKKNKKYLVMGLCSLALAGGAAITYGLNSSKQADPPRTSIKQSSTKKAKKKQAWEKQIAGESDQKEKPKKSTADKILSIIAGDSDDSDQRVFGMEIKKDKTPMLNKLAVALDEQEQKLEARLSKKNVAEAAEISKEKEDPTDILDKDLIPKLPGADDNETPIVIDPEAPINPTPPGPPVTPEDPNKPIDPPTPPIDPVEPNDPTEQIEKSKEELTAAKEKAAELNSDLQKVSEELSQLSNVESKTNQSAESIQEDLDRVAALIAEYNALSAEIKQLVETDGTVLPINYDLYNETYDKLSNKVAEIQVVQNEINSNTETMNQNIGKAKETANQLEIKKETFENDTQQKVSEAKTDVEKAVNTANQNTEVAEKVSTEIVAAETASNDLTQTNNQVAEQMDQTSSEAAQQAVTAAESTVQEIEVKVNDQNAVVENVVEDFESLPQPVTQPIVTEEPQKINSEVSNQEMNVADTSTTNVTMTTNE